MVHCQKTSIQGVQIHSNLNHMTTAESFKIAEILVGWDMNGHYGRDMKKPGLERASKGVFGGRFNRSSQNLEKQFPSNVF